MPDADSRGDEGSTMALEFGDHVNMETFSTILEMDEDEDEREFSRPLVFGFFEQADETFEKIDTALAAKDFKEISDRGHFLKGSSATLGFTKIKDNCQIIQQYGNKTTLEGAPEPDEEVCLKKITDASKAVKKDTAELVKLMEAFFGPERE